MKREKKRESKPAVSVKVEFEGARSRVRRLPLAPDLYKNLQVTDSHYYFLMSTPQDRSGRKSEKGRDGPLRL